MRIISAVTTAPRWTLEPTGEQNCFRLGEPIDYLPGTLESLRNAGFDPQIVRDEKMAGSWPTLREALKRLLASSGDALAVFQDDIRCSKWAAWWLESQLSNWDWPTVGVISLYTPSVSVFRNGWFTMNELPVYRPFGACALVFPRHSAEKLLQDPTNSGFMSGSDTSVATFCLREKLDWWMHNPSLVQHIGEVSSIAGNSVLSPERVAGEWCQDVKDLTPAIHPSDT